MDQSVTRTQYDPGTIRKFKRMLWALAFCFERLVVSTLLMVGLAVSMVIAALETYGADPVFSVPISLHAGWVCAAFLLNVNLANVQLKLGGDATTRQVSTVS